ncbi:acyl carrier protein [Labrys wisconsinensis]|uniref:Acyl carrier protein n=1 Tax=Labrys wisconsinensis TaxID=425677 RepID=A0ABU0IZ28_9HYPH|nr:acyl carrier protein [Labrys wisconsinensis]MDQ0467269.1 acyl carrier protein [Labrys wisconsinensis]
MQDRIREILASVAPLAVPIDTLSDQADLYDAGLTSFASVQLMLALESAFDVEFPEHMLTRRTFSSIAAIAGSIAELAPEHA